MAKDEDVDVILIALEKMGNIQNPLYEEVLAILFGVKMTLEWGCLLLLNQILKLQFP